MKKSLTVLVLLTVSLMSVFSNGTTETVKEEDSLRVVSLAPNITEIIYSLGAESHLVGRSDSCNYPEEVSNIPSAGNVWQPNVEVIVSMQPDVVLAASLLDPAYKTAIENAGIKVVHILSEENKEGTFDLIRQVGQAIGAQERAEDLCNEIKAEFAEISDRVSKVKEKKTCVYLLGWGEFGDFAATGETFLNDLIETAGAENIAKNARYWAISQEILIESNPDLIILPDYEGSPADVEKFKNTEPYSKLTGRIITIDGDIADRQGIRSPIFTKTVAEELYPELF